jgi:AmiR/NasT family two-component response regulator
LVPTVSRIPDRPEGAPPEDDLSRFAEYQGLEGAFARRATTERAKGILMERHSFDEQRAFEMLRDEARRSNRKLIEIAEAVTMSVNLLPRSPVE